MGHDLVNLQHSQRGENPAGRQLAERTVRPVLRAEERAFLGMAEEERASLLALYRKYLSLLRQESEQIFQQSQEE